jgi:hypothetical protein
MITAGRETRSHGEDDGRPGGAVAALQSGERRHHRSDLLAEAKRDAEQLVVVRGSLVAHGRPLCVRLM